MRVLCSNDDGVYAPGLSILVEILKKIAHVDVVAPDRNRSGSSHSLTLEHPLRIKTLDNGFISVEGTPTDCVHMALTGLLDEPPDIVISGINAGANLGDDVLYSGTVAAATEGRFLGLPAIAISLTGYEYQHYGTAAIALEEILKHVNQIKVPKQTILNINVPDVPVEALQGFEVTRFGSRHKSEPTVVGKDPRGFEIFWIGPAGEEQDAGPGTDFYAVNNNKVSITPMTVDFTHYKAMARLAEPVADMKIPNE